MASLLSCKQNEPSTSDQIAYGTYVFNILEKFGYFSWALTQSNFTLFQDVIISKPALHFQIQSYATGYIFNDKVSELRIFPRDRVNRNARLNNNRL